MRYLALATNYDGTLATDGKIGEPTLAALKRSQESGRKLILLTGQQLDDLYQTFPDANQFDCIVAGNGALIYFPATREDHLLGDRPPESFVQALQSRNIQPLGDNKCFYFREAESKSNLQAQNLISFVQLAQGVDDETWLYHLHQHDYSQWFKDAIKDATLAEDAAEVEAIAQLSASDSCDRIKAAIEWHYTLPA